MDRRQKKTREAIFNAFTKLLAKKHYNQITVGEIIEEANVGRATFYAHFETKDMLLRVMCSDIFDHIFAGNMCEYTSPLPPAMDLEAKLAHILWHLKDHKSDVTGIFSSESGELFMRYIKEYLTVLFRSYLSEFHTDVPADFLLNHLVGSFAETLRWWVCGGMCISAEEMAHYFMEVTETHGTL